VTAGWPFCGEEEAIRFGVSFGTGNGLSSALGDGWVPTLFRGGGPIGRTGSKVWGRETGGVRNAVGCGVAASGAAVGVDSGAVVALGAGGTISLEDTGGDGISLGDGDSDGDGVGEGEGLGLGFLFFGVGLGFGGGDPPVKSLLILSPNDSPCAVVTSAWPPTIIAALIAIRTKARNFIFARVLFIVSQPVLAKQLDSFGCRHRDSPAENFHWASGRDS
jgi:hypothetical protein